MDEQLHRERVDPATRGQLHHRGSLDELPDGAFVLAEGEPWLVLGSELLRWSPAGYTDRRARSPGEATVITPLSLVSILRTGWEGAVPRLHPSARG